MTASTNQITRRQLDEARARLRHIREFDMPEAQRELASHGKTGDWHDNAPLDAAQARYSFLVGEAERLDGLIRNAQVVDDAPPRSRADIEVGCVVVVKLDDASGPRRFVLVSKGDAKGDTLSTSSPIGRALLGRRAGDRFTVRVPRGDLAVEIVSIE